MKKVLTLDEWKSLVGKHQVVITIGNFDGVHKGHQKLLKEFVSYSKTAGCFSVVMSLYPHPAISLSMKEHHLIMSYSQKYEHILSMGVDYIVQIPFDSVRSLKGRAFYDQVLNEANIAKIFVGYDFKLGCDQKGLQELCSEPEKISKLCALEENGRIISSTLVRKKLLAAQVDQVRELLGHDYVVRAKVIHGKKLGRSLGFPTVNLQPGEHILIPKNGVYRVWAMIDQKKVYGALNIGINPSVDSEGTIKMEAHLVHFDGNLYGEMLDIHFEEYIRSEQKFSKIQDLISQISKDVEYVKSRIDA